MKKILITGALGQIGTELTTYFRGQYGNDNVVISDVNKPANNSIIEGGPFEQLNVVDAAGVAEVCKKYGINQIVHLAAILSARAESNPQMAYNINMNGTYNVLEVAREMGIAVFTPSSIAAFGASTPVDNTPQDTIQRPSTMYGVTKVAGELLCDYYFTKYGVDTRGVRFPGIISYAALPGGGTTDYAVHIYYEALKNKKYDSFIGAGTYMDMMYMPDALKAVHDLMEANPDRLVHRNAFNVTAMSFDPEMLAAEIKKHIPEFKMGYEVDPIRQKIANSWPNSIDDSAAKAEWGWKPGYDLASMTTDMLEKLTVKLNIK
jgi:nucleoside-diphosphate-sugar epimerase